MMDPELLTAIVAAFLVAWAAFTALRATWSSTRLGLLGGLTTALTLVLFIRLIGPFGGWTDWFLSVWLAAMLAIVVAVFRAVLVWPDLLWRDKDAKAHRREVAALSSSMGLALLVSGALIVPGLLL